MHKKTSRRKLNNEFNIITLTEELSMDFYFF